MTESAHQWDLPLIPPHTLDKEQMLTGICRHCHAYRFETPTGTLYKWGLGLGWFVESQEEPECVVSMPKVTEESCTQQP